MANAIDKEISQSIKQLYSWVVAHLMRHISDLELVEDAVQTATEQALIHWRQKGIPESPRAWLTRVAKNFAIDELRRRTRLKQKQDEIVWLESLRLEHQTADALTINDDMLRLFLAACHPSLNKAARLALTLKVVGGLETEQIAKAFLTPVPTMAQRIVRAKRKLKELNISLCVPTNQEALRRMHDIRQIIYLIFNEGYLSTQGDTLIETDLCRHAIELGHRTIKLRPKELENKALLALMLLHDARKKARTNNEGDIVLLQDQDRSLWNKEQTEQGISLVKHVLSSGHTSSYAIQAAIAAIHAEAKSTDDTDWKQIVGLYDYLLSKTPSEIIELNRAAAQCMLNGPQIALDDIIKLEHKLSKYYLYYATKADLLRRLNKNKEALDSYKKAYELCHNAAELRFLQRRINELQ